MTVFVYDPIQDKVVPKEERIEVEKKKGLTVIPDIQPFATVEGEYIGSRRSLREYEKRNNVKQLGNDWVGRKPEFMQ